MTTLRDALADLLENHGLPVDEAADRHIAPGFRQRTNGQWDDRAGFLSRIRYLRSRTREVTITVLDEITDGSRYAERHIIDLLGGDGRRTVYEVYVFASLGPDGRFERIEEATVMVGPAVAPV